MTIFDQIGTAAASISWYCMVAQESEVSADSPGLADCIAQQMRLKILLLDIESNEQRREWLQQINARITRKNENVRALYEGTGKTYKPIPPLEDMLKELTSDNLLSAKALFRDRQTLATLLNSVCNSLQFSIQFEMNAAVRPFQDLLR